MLGKYRSLLYSAKRSIKAIAIVIKRTAAIAKNAYLLAMGHPSAFSELGSLPFTFGLSRHSKQSEASSYHQKQSSHSSLGRCAIVVRTSHGRPGSALAPTTRHMVFHDVYQLANVYKKIVITISYMIYGVSAVLAKALDLAKATRRNYQVTGREDGAGDETTNGVCFRRVGLS
jgi:hypothetical protein